jgi:hypothetical protein
MTNDHAWPAVYQGELLPDPDDADGPFELAELRAALAPDREVHDWDGATGTVTTYVRCPVEDHHVWGAGIGRNRDEATRRALNSVRTKIHATV